VPRWGGAKPEGPEGAAHRLPFFFRKGGAGHSARQADRFRRFVQIKRRWCNRSVAPFGPSALAHAATRGSAWHITSRCQVPKRFIAHGRRALCVPIGKLSPYCTPFLEYVYLSRVGGSRIFIYIDGLEQGSNIVWGGCHASTYWQ
jgi:hypothetical protein